MLRLLIVDDDTSMRSLLAQTLVQSLGKVVIIEAESGNQAIKLLESGERFELIISDYQMNDGDGSVLFEYVMANILPCLFILFTGVDSVELTTTSKLFLGVVKKPDLSLLLQEVILGICMAPGLLKNYRSHPLA